MHCCHRTTFLQPDHLRRTVFSSSLFIFRWQVELLFSEAFELFRKSFSYLKVLLEVVKPVLDEEQLQDAAESLLMEGSAYDAKLLYNAMKVKRFYSFLIYILIQ